MRSIAPVILFLAAGCRTPAVTDATPRTFGAFGLVAPDTADDACKGKAVPTVDAATCKASTDASGLDGIAAGGDATSANGTDDLVAEYGPTHKGAEADDDDCKYHVAWQSTGAALNEDVYYQVDVTTKSDGKPASHLVVTEHPVYAEVLVDTGDPLTSHAVDNSGQTSQETSTPGRYLVGPIHFDQPGRWTVRFHLYGDCDDGDTSPHGHVAFFMDAK